MTIAVQQSERNQLLEMLRIVAAYGIVAYHAKTPLHDLVYSGLIIFLVLSPLVDIHYRWKNPRSAAQLANVLLIPWFFWSMIYALINIVTNRPMIVTGDLVTGILYGTSPHLWFLPYIFVVLASVNTLKKANRPDLVFWASLSLGIALLLTADLWSPVLLNCAPPFAQWIHAVPPTLIGIAIGAMYKLRLGPAIICVLVPLALVFLGFQEVAGVSIPYVIGILSVMFLFYFGIYWNPHLWNIRAISELTMGVYLSHMIWVGIFNNILGRGTFVAATAAFLAAAAMVGVLHRYLPVSRRFLG
ncbi:acyltransferase family protein [Xanthobacter flavus]|uniref:acyltransferase family protein n=1 Tax=Xanthobacter flavus TaxID=281 RepID=UPI0037290CFD